MSVFPRPTGPEGRHMRNHRIMPGARLCDTLVYSIVASEWPTVRQHLNFKLQQDYSS